MLCRAEPEVREDLDRHFESWLDKQNSSFSSIASLLVRAEERIPLETQRRKELGFLPYQKLPIFEDFADDLSKILSLELERLDKVKVMIDLVGYHIGNYVLSIGETYHACSNPFELKKPFYLIEVVSKITNSIRKTSIQSVSTQRNKLKRSLSVRASEIIGLYDHVIDSEDELEKKRKTDEQFLYAEKHLADHISNYPNVCFREIGFLSKKNTRSYRYVLTEDFLHSLVITILGNEKRLEFNSFVKQLRDRYSIYVDVSPDKDHELIQRDLNRNAKKLASLLYQMGMLRHLSDACSYVINPYREDSV
jgi:hypothetical protein